MVLHDVIKVTVKVINPPYSFYCHIYLKSPVFNSNYKI